MLPPTKAILVALFLAYRALAAPINQDQQGQVRSVIEAIKVQAGDEFPSPVIDCVEATLKANGALNAENIAALNQKIEAMTTEGGLDINEIAAMAVDRLESARSGDFPESNLALVNVTTDMISHVLGQGTEAVKRDCPHGGRICGGCVIL